MNILEITTTIGCVNNCLCCPQGMLKTAYGDDPIRVLMPDQFIEMIWTLPRTLELGWCGFSEPFLNPMCSRLIQIANDSHFQHRLLTTLVGFGRPDVERLRDCKIHYVRFHVPDTEQFTFPEDQWIEKHRLFYSMQLPADYDYMTMGDIPPKILAYLNSVGVDSDWIMRPKLITRAGNLAERPTIQGNVYCKEQRWHYNVLLPNGDVYLCCMDFGLKHKLGNLLKQPYSEIYHEAERLRLADHSTMICAKCELGQPGHWFNPFGRPTP